MRDRTLRLGLATVGVIAIGYGALRLIQTQKGTVLDLAKWLVGALVVHDGIIAPIVIAIGWVLARVVPDRVRGFVQAGLITAGLVASVAVWLIWRQGKYGARSLALLQQDYLRNTVVLLALVAGGTALSYGVSKARENRTKSRPSADHRSTAVSPTDVA
jgi:hypothetical protein